MGAAGFNAACSDFRPVHDAMRAIIFHVFSGVNLTLI
jgi:hypothetical protein